MLKKLFKFITSRLFVFAILALLQILLVVSVSAYYTWSSEAYFITSTAVGVVLAIIISVNGTNPSYRQAWLIFIIAMPLAGTLFYLFFGNKNLGAWGRRKIRPYSEIRKSVRRRALPEGLKPETLEGERFCRLSAYVRNISEYEPFAGTKATYFDLGDRILPVMTEKLAAARKFILLESFIYDSRSTVWNELLTLLRRKVAEGVEVYLIYDDMGSINTLPLHYDRLLEGYGIHAVKFNPIHFRLNPKLNFRDHRKICVIDGNIGFNGGLNFADEYFNRIIRFGHWKDTVIMLEGRAVWNYTLMFIQLWSFAKEDENAFEIQKFVPTWTVPDDGTVLAFGDSPLDEHNVSENVYLNIISSARRYVWITTPYLILDNEMITALTTAAQSGVDVRIITPHYPDKKLVFALTRANYKPLVRQGVKIYEYTPGFIHSKVFVSDDEIAVVGTTNMDYRSFYLHFECGTILMGSSCIPDIRRDYEQTLEISRQVTHDDIMRVPWYKRAWRSIINQLAPLL